MSNVLEVFIWKSWTITAIEWTFNNVWHFLWVKSGVNSSSKRYSYQMNQRHTSLLAASFVPLNAQSPEPTMSEDTPFLIVFSTLYYDWGHYCNRPSNSVFIGRSLTMSSVVNTMATGHVRGMCIETPIWLFSKKWSDSNIVDLTVSSADMFILCFLNAYLAMTDRTWRLISTDTSLTLLAIHLPL